MTNRPFGFLSNFYASKIRYPHDGKAYPTAEHLFQALKFEGFPGYMEWIRTARSPMNAKHRGKMARSKLCPEERSVLDRFINEDGVRLRSDWEEAKDGVMYQVLKLKFEQNRSVLDKLLSTGTSHLEEVAKYDGYWGTGSDGNGRNQLGITLMRIRDEHAATRANGV